MFFSRKIINVDNQGIITVQCKCESTKTIEIDSVKGEKVILELTQDDDKKAREYPQHIQKMLKSFEVKLTSNEEVKYVEGLNKQKEERKKRLMEGLSNSSSNSPIKPYVSLTFYTISLPINAYYCFVLPEKPVNIGDSWEYPIDKKIVNPEKPGEMEIKYIYSGIEVINKRKCVVIKGTMEDDQNNDSDSMKTSMRLRGTFYAYIDIDKGILLKSEQRFKTVMCSLRDNDQNESISNNIYTQELIE